MNRNTTAAIVAVAIILIFAVAILVRLGRDEPVDERTMSRATAHHTEPAGSAPDSNAAPDRSGRVLERLHRLRNDNSHSPQEPGHAEGGSAPSAREAPALTPGMDLPAGARDPDDEQELAELEQTLLNDPDPDERITAVFFLSSSDDPAVTGVLLKGLKDSDSEVRLAVVEALSDYSDDLQPDQLAPALADSDSEVRFEALSILGDMENPAANPLVESMLHDPDEDVRSLAEGIKEIGK